MKKNNRWAYIVCLVVLFSFLIAGAGEACYNYPAPHTPKPGLSRHEEAPTSYPYWTDRSFTSNLTTNFKLDSKQMELVPFTPTMYDKKPFVYFGPNNIGSYQLLSGPGHRLTPGHTIKLKYDISNSLYAWYYEAFYDWSLVNYWYSTPHKGHTESGTSCVSWADAKGVSHSYCWNWSYWVWDCYNQHEVYYWVDNIFKNKNKATKTWKFPIYIPSALPPKIPLIPTGANTSTHQIGLKDFFWSLSAELDKIVHSFFGYSINLPKLTLSQSQSASVHPNPAGNPTWNGHASNVWHPSLENTKVSLNFKWNRDSLNKGQERYYIEYDRIFDDYIKMEDIVKMLSNLGFGQVDVPVYMALENPDKPKLYLVSTPMIVDGKKVLPPGFNFNIHPGHLAIARGFIREAVTKSDGTPIFGSNGRPQGKNELKYMFTKIFDINNDDKVDSADKAFFDKAFPAADVDEDSDVDATDCAMACKFAFNGFHQAFESLGGLINSEFAKNPSLLTNSFLTSTVGPVIVKEPGINSMMQIGWKGNALQGEFYVAPVPGATSKYYAPAYSSIKYTKKSDPASTGDNFLNAVGPIPAPSAQELFKKTTMDFPDGTWMGQLKRLYVKVYPRACFLDQFQGTGTCLHAYGNPWGYSGNQLESVESGWMGNLFIRGDADGNGRFDKIDMSKWSQVAKYNGFLLSSVYMTPMGYAAHKAVVTDLNNKFKVTTGGKFAIYVPEGKSSITVKEYYNYRYLNPVIWAYDAKEGNQFSYGRRFTLEGGWDPGGPPPVPPYPPTETKNVPNTIIGPDKVPEDIPHSWSAPGAEMVVIVPGTWQQTWSITPSVPGGSGSGSSFSYEFLQAGKYTIVHTVKYTERIVSPVTDSSGIIVYYAVNDIPRSRTLSLQVVVYDHDPADFEDPILTYTGPGDTATYAPQWPGESAALRARDFPKSFKAYNNTGAFDLSSFKPLGSNGWVLETQSTSGKTYVDSNFDLVNADPATEYNYDFDIKLKFARQVGEVSDLNSANTLGKDHLEVYSGILLEDPINIRIDVFRQPPSGSKTKWREFTYSPSLNKEGSSDISQGKMEEYLVKVGSRFEKIKLSSFKTSFKYPYSIPTFPDQNYETQITLTCTRRDFSVNSGNGTIEYNDRKLTFIWKRKAYSIDVTPPTLSIEEFNGSVMQASNDGVINGNTGDETTYSFIVADNHPGHGPNDGLKNAGVRRYWYPRLWLQKIDAGSGKFTALTNGYELPIILPNLSNKLVVSADGDLDGEIANHNLERFDGHKISLYSPLDKEKLGTIDNLRMTLLQRFSPYIAGKIKYAVEIEDGSRNYCRKESYFNVVDNKRPNIDLRLACAKFRPVPDDGTLKSLDNIGKEEPPGPVSHPFGTISWASDAVKERLKASKPALINQWCHPYSSSDQKFASGKFSSVFNAAGCNYNRLASLDSNANVDVTGKNVSKYDDLKLSFSDKDIKAVFNLSNHGAPGFAEDEKLVFDLSVRDNVLFWQDDLHAPNGKVVADQNFRLISYKFVENTVDEYGVIYQKEVEEKPVKSLDDHAPLRIVNPDGTPLSYIFRVGNADVKTGLKNTSGNSSGTNSFYFKATDLGDNSRELFLDFPIIPSKFQIRVLESNTEAERINK
ncbi:hypothetical protein MASR1M12_27950 [Erysipelotrichia bacterium]